MLLLSTFFRPGQELTVRSFLPRAQGCDQLGTQGSDLTSLPSVSSSLTSHLFLILEGPEETWGRGGGGWQFFPV